MKTDVSPPPLCLCSVLRSLLHEAVSELVKYCHIIGLNPLMPHTPHHWQAAPHVNSRLFPFACRPSAFFSPLSSPSQAVLRRKKKQRNKNRTVKVSVYRLRVVPRSISPYGLHQRPADHGIATVLFLYSSRWRISCGHCRRKRPRGRAQRPPSSLRRLTRHALSIVRKTGPTPAAWRRRNQTSPRCRRSSASRRSCSEVSAWQCCPLLSFPFCMRAPI